jgi:hypothetical protein
LDKPKKESCDKRLYGHTCRSQIASETKKRGEIVANKNIQCRKTYEKYNNGNKKGLFYLEKEVAIAVGRRR